MVAWDLRITSEPTITWRGKTRIQSLAKTFRFKVAVLWINFKIGIKASFSTNRNLIKWEASSNSSLRRRLDSKGLDGHKLILMTLMNQISQEKRRQVHELAAKLKKLLKEWEAKPSQKFCMIESKSNQAKTHSSQQIIQVNWMWGDKRLHFCAN